MAYVLRYSATAEDYVSNTTYLVEILQDNYTGGSDVLTLAENGIALSIRSRSDSPDWMGIAPGSVTITFVDDESGNASNLAPLVGIEEREVQVKISRNSVEFWVGYMVPDTLTYDVYRPGSVTINGVDGFAFLQDDLYTNSGNSYEGRDTALVMIDRCLSASGLPTLYNSSIHWYPRLGSNELDENTHAALTRYKHDNIRAYDDEGNPFSCDFVVDQLARRYRARIYQWNGRVYMEQRRKLVVGSNIQTFNHANANSTTPILLTHQKTLDTGDLTGMLGFTRSFRQAYKSAGVTYDHGEPGFNIINNAGFESPILNSGGDDSTNWVRDGAITPTAETVAGGFESDMALYMAATENGSGVTTLPDDLVLGEYVHQTAGYVEGGAGRRFSFSANVNYNYGSQVNVGRGYFGYRIRVGSYWLTYNPSTDVFEWKVTPSNLEHYLVFDAGFNRNWQLAQLVSEEMLDGATPISGDLYIELYAVVEDNGGGGQNAVSGLWDNIAFTIVESDGSTANVATATYVVETTTQNVREDSDTVLRWGEGPTEGHVSRITVLDSTDTEVETSGNWQYGSDHTGSASGMSLDHLWADETLREKRIPLSSISGTIDQGVFQESLWPTQILRTVDSGTVVESVVATDTVLQITFMPLLKRIINIDGSLHRIDRIKKNSVNDYAITVSPALPSNVSAGATVTQTIDHTWRSLEYDLLQNRVRGVWDEIYNDDFSSALVTADVKENSASARGISVSAGSIQVFVNSRIETADSRTSLEALTIGNNAFGVQLEQYALGAGKGGGLFFADPDDTITASDGGTVFISSDGKRFKRVFDGVYNPTWWGVRFDGVTDDSAAWQTMIDALPPGAVVQCPAGVSLIDNGINLNGKPLTIRGASNTYWATIGYESFPSSVSEWPGTKLISGPTITEPIFKIYDDTTLSAPGGNGQGGRNNACQIEKIHFVGNRTSLNQNTATDDCGILLDGCWGVRIVDCNFVAFSQRGLRAKTAVYDLTALGGPAAFSVVTDVCHIVRVNAMDNSLYGIEWNGADSWLVDCRCAFNNTGLIIGTTNNHVKGGYYDLNVARGIRCNGSQGNTFDGLFINANGGNGIWMGDGTTGTNGNKILGCEIRNNGRSDAYPAEQRAGIFMHGGTNIIIEGNTMGEDSTDPNVFKQTYDIYLGGSWFNARIRSNTGSGATLGHTNLLTRDIEGHGYNPLEHGAAQRTQDAAAILQAIVDDAVDGEMIRFPSGNYRLSTTLNVNKSIRLIGVADNRDSGIGSYLRGEDALNAPLLSLQAEGVVVEHLNFSGSPSPSGLSSAAVGIEVQAGAHDCRIAHCVVADFVGDNISALGNTNRIIVDNVLSVRSGANGIKIQSTDAIVRGCRAFENATNGIQTVNSRNVQLEGNVCRENGNSGVRMDGGFYTKVMGGAYRLNGFNGVHVRSGQNHSIIGTDCLNNGTTAQVVSNQKKSGIYIEDGENIVVHSNQCSDEATGATQPYGIAFGAALMSADAKNNIGSGNTIDFLYFDPSSAVNVNTDMERRFTYNVPSLIAMATHTVTITIEGARSGDVVTVGVPDTHNPLVIVSGFITADDTATILWYNTSAGAIDLANGDYTAIASRRNPPIASTGSPGGGSNDPILEYQYTTGENLLTYA